MALWMYVKMLDWSTFEVMKMKKIGISIAFSG